MKKQPEKSGVKPPPAENKADDLYPKTLAYWVCRNCRYHEYTAFTSCPNCGGRRISKRDVDF